MIFHDENIDFLHVHQISCKFYELRKNYNNPKIIVDSQNFKNIQLLQILQSVCLPSPVKIVKLWNCECNQLTKN